MANNYTDTTGVLKLKQVTPVIEALFRGHGLDPEYPGNGEAYIGISENLDLYPSWGHVYEGLNELVEKLGITLPAMKADIPFHDKLKILVESLFTHFGVNQRDPRVALLIDQLTDVGDYDTPELNWLFDVAWLMNDGHGLEYYQVEGARTCSKPRLEEFGGYGEYHSATYHMYSTSFTAGYLGPKIDVALQAKNYEEAAKFINERTHYALDYIADVQARNRVAQHMAAQILQKYTPIPSYIEAQAANDTVTHVRFAAAMREQFGK